MGLDVSYNGVVIADGVDYGVYGEPAISKQVGKSPGGDVLIANKYTFTMNNRAGVGFLAIRFDSRDDLIELTKECFKIRFVGDWELWINENCKTYKVEL
jgi:hypothetical protein